ncbi:hypothetical protein [Brevibacillus laterosporus]|uniref:hypothetical protein n=1 Tax=Brevibacillus laterosporus TaxID=1465 RepID=UPI0018F8A579|nr:hypothetical protein [Brevibacillus laterosporus]MBG9774275.1 hypothetical protein [Brevibacillus laterosporus]
MITDIPASRNLKTTILNGKYVSSAEVWRFIEYLSGWTKTYETYVWEYDTEKKILGKWLYETYQNSEEEALNVHDHMVSNFTKIVREE